MLRFSGMKLSGRCCCDTNIKPYHRYVHYTRGQNPLTALTRLTVPNTHPTNIYTNKGSYEGPLNFVCKVGLEAITYFINKG